MHLKRFRHNSTQFSSLDDQGRKAAANQFGRDDEYPERAGALLLSDQPGAPSRWSNPRAIAG